MPTDATRLPTLRPGGLSCPEGGFLVDPALRAVHRLHLKAPTAEMARNLPGARRSGKQATFSSGIIHDTLRRHDPGPLM